MFSHGGVVFLPGSDLVESSERMGGTDVHRLLKLSGSYLKWNYLHREFGFSLVVVDFVTHAN